MGGNQNKGRGRPPLDEKQKNEIVKKLEPYLKAGLSMRKSCLEAGVPRSTVYKILDQDEQFMDQIRRYQQFLSVAVSNSMVRQLFSIKVKQNNGEELTTDDLGFLKWFATHSKATKEEFGKRHQLEVQDPEVEIQRIAHMIDEAAQ